MRLCLFPTYQAPGEARRGVTSLLEGRVDRRSLDDVRTVISELVTISVAHGATQPIDIRLNFLDGTLEGQVYDAGPGARAMVRARERRDSSLLMRVVDSLVDDWGTNPSETRVWFRMSVGHRR